MISLVLQIVSLPAHSDFAGYASILHQKQPFHGAHFANSPALLHDLKSTSLANPEFFDSGIVRNNASEGKEFTFLEIQKDKYQQKVHNCLFPLVLALYLLFSFGYIRD